MLGFNLRQLPVDSAQCITLGGDQRRTSTLKKNLRATLLHLIWKNKYLILSNPVLDLTLFFRHLSTAWYLVLKQPAWWENCGDKIYQNRLECRAPTSGERFQNSSVLFIKTTDEALNYVKKQTFSVECLHKKWLLSGDRQGRRGWSCPSKTTCQVDSFLFVVN